MMVLDNYPMPPHSCFYCRGSATPCVDTMRDDEDNPNHIEHVYLCANCLLHAARIIAPSAGLAILPKQEWADLHASLERATANAAEAVQTRDELKAALDSLVKVYGKPEPVAAGNGQRKGR